MFNTVLNVTNDDYRANIPVLSIIAYQDEEDAVRIANDTDYGLSGMFRGNVHAQALHLFTGNVGRTEACCRPFGGYKQSQLVRMGY